MSRALRLSLTLLAAGWLVAHARTARAQAGSGTPPLSYEAVMNAPVGAWADYSTTVKGRPEEVKVRYTLVEKTAKKMAVAIETRSPVGPVQIRMELDAVAPPPPKKDVEWKISKMTMKLPTSEQPQEVPVPPSTPTVKKGEGLGPVLGHAAVKTPVGTFDCKRYQVNAQAVGTFDVWMSDKVTPVGLVKQADQNGMFTTILTAMGTGTPPPLAAPTPAASPAPAEKAPAPTEKPAAEKPAAKKK